MAISMTLSAAGLAAIAHSEGFKSVAYADHKGQSIGYGHLLLPGEAEKYENGITEPEARALLSHDTALAAADVNRMVDVSLTQAQFDALVDFTYNLGTGPLSRIASTLNTGDMAATAARIRLYNNVRVNGVLVPNAGLTTRRDREAKTFEEQVSVPEPE